MGIGQILVYRWSCRVLEDAATNLFLTSQENRVDKIFMQLADYFKGTAGEAQEGHSHDGRSLININFYSKLVRI